MSLACYRTHKKPVCDKCDAGTSCTKCCPCQPRLRGRPKKVSVVQETPHRSNPERRAATGMSFVDEPISIPAEIDTTEGPSNYTSSQKHILDVLKLMGCDEHKRSVRSLPHVEMRRQVTRAMDSEIDNACMNRVQNVFWIGVKAWAHVLLPNLRLDEGSKKAFSLQFLVGSPENPVNMDAQALATIPTTIRDILKAEKKKKQLKSNNARKLLVSFVDVPTAYVASLLTLSKDHAARVMFQAKIDKLYLTHGMNIQQFSKTQPRVPKDVIEFAVEFIYSDENIGRLAWEAKKRTPNRKEKWKELKNVFAMRSLVLKNDIATMYAGYIAKHEDAMPGKPPIGRSLFYTIAKHITGGGKQQEARAGVDYIKVNFHIDNFSIVDKLIDILAPLSDVDHTLRNELRGLRTDVYTFLSYGYALHAREGVKASEDTEDQCDYSHQPQEHEVQQLRAYQELEELVSQPDKLDDPGIQEAIVSMIRGQLSCCAQFKGSVVENSNSATTHSPVFSLDLTSHRKPNKNPKAGGHLECNACRSPFLFFDKLRHVALMKLDRSPTKLSELADVLLTIHQCERRSYRYMAHVMQAAQQAHRMKLAIAEMDSSTAYIVYDFKQKFLAKGFREGGDSYYGKKGMMWWGAGVFIKPETRAVISSPSSCTDKLYVEIDFSSEEARLRNEMEAMNIDNLDEGNSYLLGELDEHELRGEESEHELRGEESEHEVEDEESEHEVEDESNEHEVLAWEDESNEHEVGAWDEGSEHEVEGEGSEHEVEDEGSEHEVEDDGSEHEVEDEGSEHEVEDEGSEHEVEDEESEHEVEGEGSEHEMEDESNEHEVLAWEDESNEHEVGAWDEGSEHEVEGEGSEHEVEDEGSEHEVEDDGSELEVEDEGSEHEVEDERSEHEVEDDGSEHDNSGSNDDLSVHEKDQPTLHFIDCIVQGEQKCDANVCAVML